MAAPGFDAPGFDAPGFDAPGFSAPGFDAPGFDAPKPAAEQQAAPTPQLQPPGQHASYQSHQQPQQPGGAYSGGTPQHRQYNSNLQAPSMSVGVGSAAGGSLYGSNNGSGPGGSLYGGGGGSLYGGGGGGGSLYGGASSAGRGALPPPTVGQGYPPQGGIHLQTPQLQPPPHQLQAPQLHPPHGSGGHPPRAPRGDRPATNTVWLGYLDPQFNEDSLRSIFGRFGNILRVTQMHDRQIAFVHFREVSEAQRAVETVIAERALGTAKVSYGKQFSYDEEEMARLERQAVQRRSGPPGGMPDGMGGHRPPPGGLHGAPPARREPRPENPPSNILFVGDLNQSIAEDDLRSTFSAFGELTSVNYVSHKGFAFIHFGDVEQCSKALRSMQGQAIRGNPIRVSFGAPRRENPPMGGAGGGPMGGAGDGATGGRFPPNDNSDREPPTNVVWVGGVPSTVTEAEMDGLFQGYEGYIDCNLYRDKCFAFGHFDTVEQAVTCRRALQGQQLHGQYIRVGHGKNNHTRSKGGPNAAPSLDAAAAGPRNGYDANGNPMLTPPPGMAPANVGALVSMDSSANGGGQLLPAEGNGGPSSHRTPAQPAYVTRTRPVPTITLDNRVAALGAVGYFQCNVPAPHLPPSAVGAICDAVDATVDDATRDQLTTALREYLAPTVAPHCCAVVAKRLRDYFRDDPHKKLLVFYGLSLAVHDSVRARSALDAFAMVAAVVITGQDPEGAVHITAVLKSFRQYCNPDTDPADAALLQTFDGIEAKQRTESDLASLLSKVRGAKAESS